LPAIYVEVELVEGESFVLSVAAIHINCRVLREIREVQHDMRPHAHSVDLELVVANEAHRDLVLRRHLKVRILVEGEAVLIHCNIDNLKELGIRGGVVGHSG